MTFPDFASNPSMSASMTEGFRSGQYPRQQHPQHQQEPQQQQGVSFASSQMHQSFSSSHQQALQQYAPSSMQSQYQQHASSFSQPHSIRTNGYGSTANQHTNPKSPSDDRFSSLGSSTSNASAYDAGYGGGSLNGQHPRSRMVFSSQAFSPPAQQGPAQFPMQMTSSGGQRSNGMALGLGGIDEYANDDRGRERFMSPTEKAIFGFPGPSSSLGLTPAGPPPGPEDYRSRGLPMGSGALSRSRPDTVVDRLRREVEDDDLELGDDDDEDFLRGRGHSDSYRQPAYAQQQQATQQNNNAQQNSGTARNPSRTRTRTRTRSKSKRRGGRSRSDSRNPGSRIDQSRDVSRSRAVTAEPVAGRGDKSEKDDIGFGDREGFGSNRGIKRETAKKPLDREEISTIFMVGFPDDITEREFSNIFTFAHGFEAASLKFPNAPSVLPAKDASTPTMSLPLAVQQQLGIYTPETARSSNMTSPIKREAEDGKDDEESVVGGASGEPARALSAAAAAALGLGQNSTASSSTTSLVGMLNSVNRGPPRRQVIGFARFRTRADALVARDTLQGRKIDVFSSATLKVEMAKKNLHSRRGFGSGPLSLTGVPESEIMDVLMRSGKLPGLLAGMGMGGFVLNRERSQGSQGHARHQESVDVRSGASTPSGRRMSMSDSFATLSLATHSAAAVGAQQAQSHPMPSLGQATEDTADYPSEGRMRASSSSQVGRMDQGAPVFSPRYASMEIDTTPMNNKTQKHRRNDSLRSVFSADWSNPLLLAQVPEHPFNASSTSYGDRRSDEHASGQLGSSLGGSAASGHQLSSSSGAASAAHSSDRQVGLLSSSDPNSSSGGFASPMPFAGPTNSKALLALAEAEDEDWNVGGVGMEALGSFDGESRNNSPAPHRQDSSVTSPTNGFEGLHRGGSRLDDPSFAPRALTGTNGRRSISGMVGPRSLSDFGGASGVGSLNIADQNPPINTLYVGNLPSHLAVTQSPNYLEECLRNLFTRAAGFKRMSFRQKVNGPMCFVEFDSVEFATLAIKELYGNTLGGLVKGGLRLSYSKNSLGQRGNGQPPTRINTSQSIVTMSDVTSPGSYASPSSSVNGMSYIANYVPGRNGSNDSGMAASSFKSETPLSPLAVPFNSSALPHDTVVNMTSPRLQRFPSSGSEGRQTRDGSLASISPRAGFSAPWPMTSINPQANLHGAVSFPSSDNGYPRNS